MTTWLQRAALAVILLVAAALRLTGINWDNYDHHHPDERYIGWVAATIDRPSNWADAFDPVNSSLNPYYWSPDAVSNGIVVPRDEQRKFAYGHLPLYMGVAATRIAERLSPLLAPRLPADWLLTRDLLNASEMIEYRHLTAVTRALTALVDVATVGLLFLLGRRLYGVTAGLLAAAFLALNVMHIQLAHFFAFDPYMTFFVVAAVTLMVFAGGHKQQHTEHGDQPWSRRRGAYLLLAAAAVGLAVGSKFAAVLLFLPLAVTIFCVPMKRRWLWFTGTAVVAIGLFLVTNPFAVLDLTCELITPSVKLGPIRIPALDWRSCFLDNVATQAAMVRGRIDLPFTRQYAGTIPYLYYIEMQLRSGMGPSLGVVAFAGFGWAVWRTLLAGWRWFRQQRSEGTSLDALDPAPLWRSHGAHFVILAWTIPFFVVTGGFYVKFMRYLQPLTPFLMLFAAAMISAINHDQWRRVIAATLIIMTGMYALSFVNVYDQPHPWTAASLWIYDNVEPGSLILSEKWDDALPVGMVVDDVRRRRSEYESAQLTWLSGTGKRDDLDKLESNLEFLADADYVTLVTNRVYGVLPRLPKQYPISSQFHPMLFDGSLGYQMVAIFGRFPNLSGYHLKPDTFGWPGLEPGAGPTEFLSEIAGLNWGRIDESFTVYDQPLTMIFKNVGEQTSAEMLRRFQLD